MSRIPGTEIVVRTYNDDMSETESFVSDSVSDPDSELDEGQDKTLNERIQESKDFVQSCIHHRHRPWILVDMEARRQIDGETIVQWPTASKLNYKTLHPSLYRCVSDVGSLNDLSRLLQAPVDWEARYNAAMLNGAVHTCFTIFKNLPASTPEAPIESAFSSVVQFLSWSIGAMARANPQTRVIVGGILAEPYLNARAQTDTYFVRVVDGYIGVSTEAKGVSAFALGLPFYLKSRMTQVLTALYGHGAPTLLYTNQQFKLFVENENRNGILTFPFGNSGTDALTNSREMGTMDDDTLLKIIAICLLSTRPSRAAKPENITDFTRKVPGTGSIEKELQEPPRRSERLMSRSDVQSESSFFTGLDDHGNPMYRAIRVMPDELVQQIEDDIEAREKSERLSKPSPLAMDSNETL